MFKRSVNVRFALILSAIIGATSMGLYFVHGWQIRRNAGSYKSRAEQAASNGDKLKAAGFYDRYLKFRFDDIDARTQFSLILADLAKDKGSFQNAYLSLERVLRDAPDQLTVRRRAADMAMAIDRPSDAKFHLEELLKINENDPTLLEQLGACEELGGRSEAAITRLEQAIAIDRERVACYPKLAAAYRRTGKTEEADLAMNRMVDANPKSPRALLERARYLRNLGLLDAASRDIVMIRTKLAPDEQEAILISGELAASRNQLDVARMEFERGRTLYPKDLRFQIGVIRLDLNSGRTKEAVAALQTSVAGVPDSSGDVWLLADLCITADQVEMAKLLISQLSKDNSLQPAVNYLESRILIKDRKWLAATNSLVKNRPELSRLPELAFQVEMLLVSCYSELERPDKQLDAARAAVAIEPTAISARLAVADAKLASANVNEALDEYLKLVGRSLGARFAAVRLMIWQNQNRQGVTPDWTRAEQLLEATPPEGRATVEYRLLVASTLSLKGKPADARSLLEEVAKVEPKETRYWLALAVLVGRESGPRSAEIVLDRAEAAAGDTADLRLARASHLMAERASIERIRKLEIGSARLPSADSDRLLLGLADVYTTLGAKADARRLLDLLAVQQPNHVALRMRQFQFEVEDGDLEKIKNFVGEIRKIEGEEGASWRYCDAVYQATVAQRENSVGAAMVARSRLAEVSALRPTWAKVPLLEAKLDDWAGNTDNAIEKYRRAIRSGERSVTVVRRAASLLIARRRFDEARDLISEAGISNGNSPELARISTELSVLRERPFEESLALATSAISTDSKIPQDHVWLGTVFVNYGKNAEAEASFRMAIQLGPKDPVCWTALIEFLVRSNKKNEAIALIEKVKSNVPAEQLSVCLARCYATVGDRANAAQQYDLAYRQSPNDLTLVRELAEHQLSVGETEKAERLLRQLSDRIANTPTAIWARRTLALTLASKGDYRNGTDALGLIDINLQEHPDSPEDKRARAIVLLGRPGSRRQSIRLLEESFIRIKPLSDELFLLAKLYETDGQWNKANELYLDLLTNRAIANPRFMVEYILGLIRRKETEKAVVWLTKLESLPNADAGRIVELKARLLKASGKTADASQILMQFAEKDFQTRKNPTIWRAVGLMLGELELPVEGETAFRKYVVAVEAKFPAANLEFAEFIARQNRIGLALEAIERIANNKVVGHEAVARSAVAVIRLGKPDDATIQRASAIITTAKKSLPNSIDLMVSSADFLDATGKYSEAILSYRQILTLAPDNPLAKNNLAWLLVHYEKNMTEALELANKLISMSGPLDIYLDTRSMVFLRSGQNELAMRDLTAAIEQSNRLDFQFHMALVYDATGNPADAKRTVRKANQDGLTERDLHPLERPEYRRLTDSTNN